MYQGRIYERKVEFPPDHDPDKYYPGGPAGSINSCANDLTKWVTMLINKGVYKGKQLIKEETLNEIFRPAMVDYWGENPDVIHPSAALGWFTYVYRGHLVVSHGGFWGTCIYLLPRERIGIIYLPPVNTNATDPIGLHIVDRLLSLEPIDWFERMHIWDNNSQPAQESQPETEKAPPTRALQDYTGTYYHPAYMKLEIALKDQGLVVKNYGGLELRHCNADTFQLYDENGDPTMKFTFHAGPDGTIDTVTAPMEPQVKDIVFKRI
ncbi:MAG TPA: serine hydrolase [Clostridia bacterium]|nr:serine hydrolase [Clostridia bacterium]